MGSLLLKIRTYARLGLANIFRVAWYQARLKSGWFAKRLPIEEPVQGKFFVCHAACQTDEDLTAAHSLFGWKTLPLNEPPDWHRSVLTGLVHEQRHLHWKSINDFTSNVGDIKGIWEPSRFGWSIDMVRNFLSCGDEAWIARLNHWLNDWSQNNPPNQGANWKCAQETSFRILHLAACALMLKQTTPSETLAAFIRKHLTRIQPTLGYARAQDNNHGTSEAAALYIGASWLLTLNTDDKALNRTLQLGERYLIERAIRLIDDDGTFSQYSVNYHRVMLQTLSMVELWRRFLGLPTLSEDFYDRAGRATNWLYQLVDEETGDAPNLGANDGAHILNFAGTEYRDFRTEIELASHLFDKSNAFDVSLPTYLKMLVPDAPELREQPRSTLLGKGGFVTLRGNRAWSVMRAPRLRFRPAQADFLHIDLWVKGRNVLRDSGSFSYNTDAKWLNYFPSVRAHNTVEFDGQDQMPKLSRFLYAHWPEDDELKLNPSKMCMSAAYSDWQGHRQHRKVILEDYSLTVHDTLSGIGKLAILRWHLLPGEWIQDGNTFATEGLSVTLKSAQSLTRLTLAEGPESRYYGQKSPMPVIEAEFGTDNHITTIINWT